MIKKILLAFMPLLFLTACQNESTPLFQEPEQTPCTQEAKICPDGSSVGRTGPTCEFAACPELDPSKTPAKTPVPDGQANNQPPLNVEGWKTVNDEKQGLTFQYPDPLKQTYTSLLTEAEFAPKIKIDQMPFSCEISKNPSEGPVAVTESRTIDAQVYCINTQRSAAMGSRYDTYNYSTSQNNKAISLNFTLQQVNCQNYDDPEKSACEREQAAFNPDDLAVKILKAAKF